ncbi:MULTISPECIES: autotransporter domain-containing protein [unclassified Rhizobium]|uniref:autotransporter outer membrane beta-barrel domain-containing protein n=1 Tax=unclassified Rhizobium TaxID=2613769 RepID=UPI0038229E9F
MPLKIEECARKSKARIAARREAVVTSLILLSSMACLVSAPAHAAEPWIMVEKRSFTDNPIPYRGQGVTTDGTNWYFSGTNALDKTNANFETSLKTSSAIAAALANPSAVAPKGLNHIGDIDYANGLLYISLDSSRRDPVTGAKYNTPVFAIYNASDLSFTGQAFALNPPHGKQDIASWVAVDAKNGVGYGMAYDNAKEIAVYNLSDWTFKKYIPLSQTIDQAQGGKILDGWMYFSTDNDSKTIYRANLATGQVEVLGNLKIDGEQEVEGLSFGQTKDGWSLYILNREAIGTTGTDGIGFYRYLRPYGNALSGEIHASVKGTFITDSAYLRDTVSNRIRTAFDNVGASSSMVTTYDEKGMHQATGSTEGIAIWSEAFGSKSKADGEGYAAGIDHSTGGFLVGADAAAGTWRFGLVGGYSNTSFDVDARSSSGSSDNYHFGLYGGSQWDAIGFRTGVFYSAHSLNTMRHVVFPAFNETLSADYDARTTQAFAELGYKVNLSAVAFEPFANLAYVHLKSDGFSETGGTIAALSSDGNSTNATFTTIGLRASTDIPLADTKVKARGMVGWKHAYGDVTPNSEFAFKSGASFGIDGAPIAKDALALEAGLDFAVSQNAAISASYTGQVARNSTDHTFKLNVGMKF